MMIMSMLLSWLGADAGLMLVMTDAHQLHPMQMVNTHEKCQVHALKYVLLLFAHCVVHLLSIHTSLI